MIPSPPKSVKNPLFSNAVANVSVQDYTQGAVLVPPPKENEKGLGLTGEEDSFLGQNDAGLEQVPFLVVDGSDSSSLSTKLVSSEISNPPVLYPTQVGESSLVQPIVDLKKHPSFLTDPFKSSSDTEGVFNQIPLENTVPLYNPSEISATFATHSKKPSVHLSHLPSSLPISSNLSKTSTIPSSSFEDPEPPNPAVSSISKNIATYSPSLVIDSGQPDPLLSHTNSHKSSSAPIPPVDHSPSQFSTVNPPAQTYPPFIVPNTSKPSDLIFNPGIENNLKGEENTGFSFAGSSQNLPSSKSNSSFSFFSYTSNTAAPLQQTDLGSGSGSATDNLVSLKPSNSEAPSSSSSWFSKVAEVLAPTPKTPIVVSSPDSLQTTEAAQSDFRPCDLPETKPTPPTPVGPPPVSGFVPSSVSPLLSNQSGSSYFSGFARTQSPLSNTQKPLNPVPQLPFETQSKDLLSNSFSDPSTTKRTILGKEFSPTPISSVHPTQANKTAESIQATQPIDQSICHVTPSSPSGNPVNATTQPTSPVNPADGIFTSITPPYYLQPGQDLVLSQTLSQKATVQSYPVDSPHLDQEVDQSLNLVQSDPLNNEIRVAKQFSPLLQGQANPSTPQLFQQESLPILQKTSVRQNQKSTTFQPYQESSIQFPRNLPNLSASLASGESPFSGHPQTLPANPSLPLQNKPPDSQHILPSFTQPEGHFALSKSQATENLKPVSEDLPPAIPPIKTEETSVPSNYPNYNEGAIGHLSLPIDQNLVPPANVIETKTEELSADCSSKAGSSDYPTDNLQSSFSVDASNFYPSSASSNLPPPLFGFQSSSTPLNKRPISNYTFLPSSSTPSNTLPKTVHAPQVLPGDSNIIKTDPLNYFQPIKNEASSCPLPDTSQSLIYNGSAVQPDVSVRDSVPIPPQAKNSPFSISNLKRPSYAPLPGLAVSSRAAPIMEEAPSQSQVPFSSETELAPSQNPVQDLSQGSDLRISPRNTESPPAVPPSFTAMAHGQTYRPVYHHWFYKKGTDAKSSWSPFSMADSLNLEQEFTSNELCEDTIVATDGGRYDVHIVARMRTAIYWDEPDTEVRRCSWFVRAAIDAKYIPYDENISQLLEEEYKMACCRNEWSRRVELSDGEVIIIHSPHTITHHQRSSSPDPWGNPPQMQQKPRIVKRGLDEFDIPEGEPTQVDHLLLLVHGIGKVCDWRFRSLVEVVDDFRTITGGLIQSHYKTAVENGKVGRVEVLPVEWHKALHSEAIDQRLADITLPSIPKARQFTNETLLDVLFYTSPVFCERIVQAVGAELNRVYSLYLKRHPGFNGGVSLGGHSLGSLILFDTLCHQKPHSHLYRSPSVSFEEGDEALSSLGCLKTRARLSRKMSYLTIGSSGTGQPYIDYPQLLFQPRAFFALGSPIGMFVTVRGIESLGEDFKFPTCPSFFNIFHPNDPVAYRIEGLISSDMANHPPVLIPHHKGRKRMHLELKETMVHVTAALKQKLVDSVRNTWNTFYQLAMFHRNDQKAIEHEVDKVIQDEIHGSTEPVVSDLSETSSTTDDAGLNLKVGHLNGGRRIDYVLQEAPLETFNQYISAIRSHAVYWESEDTLLMILKEIYEAKGITADCQVAQPILPFDLSPEANADPGVAYSHYTVSPNLSSLTESQFSRENSFAE